MSPWGYAVWNEIGQLLDTRVQLVVLTLFFFLERPKGPSSQGYGFSSSHVWI